VYVLLGITPAAYCGLPTFRNLLSVPSSKAGVQCEVCEVRIRNAPRICWDTGSALPFQTGLTQTKPVLPLPNEHGSQLKDQGRRQCCHTKHKKLPYRPTRDVSLPSGHGNITICKILLIYMLFICWFGQ
jgi:hypothetical protein